MASVSKLVTLRRPEESLRPEFREFLDAVIVPALIRRWISEKQSEPVYQNSVDGNSREVTYFDATRSPKKVRTKK